MLHYQKEKLDIINLTNFFEKMTSKLEFFRCYALRAFNLPFTGSCSVKLVVCTNKYHSKLFSQSSDAFTSSKSATPTQDAYFLPRIVFHFCASCFGYALSVLYIISSRSAHFSLQLHRKMNLMLSLSSSF